jgi:hypothetical protein
VRVNGHLMHRADLDSVEDMLDKAIKGELEPCEAGHACH